MKKKEKSCSLTVHPLIKSAIYDAMIKALRAKQVKIHIHTGVDTSTEFYNIDGEIYSESTAIEKILGEYSWWNE